MKSHGLLNSKEDKKRMHQKKKALLDALKALKDEQAKKKNR